MFGDRFNRSWMIARQSYAVLKTNPSLAIFPILSSIAALIVTVPFALFLRPHDYQPGQRPQFDTVHYIATFGMYFCNYLAIVFFNSALVACANENLQGRPADLKFGINAALSRMPQIIGWALVASTVGMVLRLINERVGIVGNIVTSIIGVAWNVAVYFVVPCMVLDKEGPFKAISNSAAMIKKTWGERVILGIGVGSAVGVLYLIAMIPILVALFLFTSQMVPLAIVFACVGIVAILAVSIVASALTAVFQTALYVYVRTGAIPATFTPDVFDGAFKTKQKSGLFN